MAFKFDSLSILWPRPGNPGNTTVSTSVGYATAPGTAATNDYIGVSGTLTFAPGETSKTISVTARTDIRAETDEVFYVNLSGATGGATVTDSQGAGTIYDDGAGGSNRTYGHDGRAAGGRRSSRR